MLHVKTEAICKAHLRAQNCNDYTNGRTGTKITTTNNACIFYTRVLGGRYIFLSYE
jgi:hypothetical protein